jgi:hypothetical protein
VLFWPNDQERAHADLRGRRGQRRVRDDRGTVRSQSPGPLQRDIDFIIRILVIVVTQPGILLGLSFVIKGGPW